MKEFDSVMDLIDEYALRVARARSAGTAVRAADAREKVEAKIKTLFDQLAGANAGQLNWRVDYEREGNRAHRLTRMIFDIFRVAMTTVDVGAEMQAFANASAIHCIKAILESINEDGDLFDALAKEGANRAMTILSSTPPPTPSTAPAAQQPPEGQ